MPLFVYIHKRIKLCLSHKERHTEAESTTYLPAETVPSHKENSVLDNQKASEAPEIIQQANLVFHHPEAFQIKQDISLGIPDYSPAYRNHLIS